MDTLHRERYIKFLNDLMLALGLGVVVSLLLEYGFNVSAPIMRLLHCYDYAVLVYFVLHDVLKYFLVRNKSTFLRTNRLDITFILLLVIFSLLYNPLWQVVHFAAQLQKVPMRQIAKLYIVVTQVFVFFASLFSAIRFGQKFAFANFRPITILLGSFAAIILIGTGLLMLPNSTTGGHISFVNALFTATSATCVTGLIVVDTGTYFTHLGRWVIMLLIQTGGLGIMTMAAFFAIALGARMSVTGRLVMRDLLSGESIEKIGQSLWQILGLTLVFEAAGTIALYTLFPSGTKFQDGRLFTSLFHSVSAFCNAGFSTFSTSLMNFQNQGLLVATFGILIILGGLGFPVLINLLGHRFFGTTGPFGQKKPRVNNQTHVVLWITGALIFAGAGWIWLTQYVFARKQVMSLAIIINSFFQSITARTAGFNTIDIGKMAIPALLGLMILMFIGASPGSTGGGIKTTTFYLAIRAMFTKLRGIPTVEYRHRAIPHRLLYRSLLLILGSQAVILTSWMLLTISEALPPFSLLFETISAFGTVGLSMGATPHLSVFGRYVIIATMYIGRVGPLAFVIALGRRERKQIYEYPEESIMIG